MQVSGGVAPEEGELLIIRRYAEITPNIFRDFFWRPAERRRLIDRSRIRSFTKEEVRAIGRERKTAIALARRRKYLDGIAGSYLFHPYARLFVRDPNKCKRGPVRR